jgi:transcription elongation factor GreA
MIAELRQRIGNELEALSEELARWMALALDDFDSVAPPPVDEERVSYIRRRMSTLGSLVAGLAGVEPTMIPKNRAGFGSVVRIRDMVTGEEHTYTLMTGDLVNLSEGHVSLASPIGNALLGRARGEEVSVITPRGLRRYKLLTLCTLPQRLAGNRPGIPESGEEAVLQAV